MEELIDPSESFTGTDERVEPMELLEEYWFFENLLSRKTRMFRSSSEPSPSNMMNQEMLAANTTHDMPPQKTKLHKDDGLVHRNLLRTPSLPPCIGRKKLVREETDHLPSKLTQQASLPQQPTCKIMSESHSIQRNQAGPEPPSSESSMKNSRKNYSFSSKEISRGQRLSHRKSLSALEFEEVQGFKDLGFVFDKEDLNPTVVNMIPGLQDKSHRIEREEDEVKRPYLSEAWYVQRSAPPIPNWLDGRSAGDKKEQIKFWARAVASNMRLEC